MLTRLKITFVALLGLALLAPGAAAEAHAAGKHGWVVYSGNARGLRVVFEVNGHRLTPAYVSVPLVCVREGRPRHTRFEEVQGRDSAILVNRRGRFHEHQGRNDSIEFESRRIVGRVTPGTIEGAIAVSSIRRARFDHEECHSGKALQGPLEELSFRADRHRSRP
jgi:hypothetical protein